MLPLHLLNHAWVFAAIVAAVSALASCQRQTPTHDASLARRVLVFTKTAGFRHESIGAGIEAVRCIALESGFHAEFTEDAALFESDSLARFAAVMFLNTSGDVLGESHERALEEFVERGGGFAGVHAAADTEHGWEWYARLVGARFKSHPAVQPATIHVTGRAHPSTQHLPERWRRTDEWYNFDRHPRERIGKTLCVLATLDETSYQGGEMNGEHPFAWCHQIGKGRAWYTGGGHTIESYSEAEFVAHLRGGIEWVLRRGN